MGNKNPIISYIEYLPAIAILNAIKNMPYEKAMRVAKFLGRLAYKILPSSRKDALNGLKIAFPNLSIEEREQIALSSFESMVLSFAELALMPSQTNEDIKKRCEMVGFENLEKASAKGKGVIGLAAHLGGWEYISAASGVYGYNPHVIVRALDNPLLNERVREYRKAKGAIVIERGQYEARKIYKALKNGKSVAFLIDQNWAVGGVFVPFFGKLAATARGPAELAIKTGAPIVPFWDIRNDDYTHTVYCGEEIEVVQGESHEESVKLTTAKFTAFYEKIISEKPRQWLWVHPRWRKRPDDE